MKEDILKIVGIKTKNKYFIKGIASSYKVNDCKPETAKVSGWFICKEPPRKVTSLVNQPRVNHRFELIDSAFVENLQPILPKSEVMEETEAGYCDWKEEFRHLRSLYREVSDEQPPLEVEHNFTFEVIFEVDDLEFTNFSYPIGNRYTKQDNLITERAIKHQVIDRLFFPDILLCKTPSMLSSKESYDIVRRHVQLNINPKVAVITSDYDFCFTVKKRVLLNEPTHKKEELFSPAGKSYKNKKYRDVYIKSREVTVFEMTNSIDNYKGYTVLPGFCGENHEDLKNNIDIYLENLMSTINTPVTDCPYCNGMGVKEC